MVTIDPSLPPQRPPQVTTEIPASAAPNRQKLGAYGKFIIQMIIGQVAMALGNVEVLGTHPLAFLTAWGTQIETNATNAFIASQTATTTANNAQTTATTAQTTATSALSTATTALGNWTTLLAGIPGVSSVPGLVTFLTGLSSSVSTALSNATTALANAGTALTNATAALGNWTSTFSAIPGVSSITDFTTWLTGLGSTASSALSNATTALGNWTSLFSGLSGASNITNFISWLTNTNTTASTASTTASTASSTASSALSSATTALGNWTSLFSGLSGASNITNFISWLSSTLTTANLASSAASAASSAASAANTLATAAQSAATAAQSTATNALTNWTQLFAGLPGVSTGTNFVTWLGGLTPIDTLYQAWGGTGTNHTTADLIAKAQAIDNQYVTGALGQPDIGQSVGSYLDKFVQGIGSQTGSNYGLGDAGNIGAQLAAFLGFNPNPGTTPPDSSVAGVTQATSDTVANQAIYKSAASGSDRSADVPFDLYNAMPGASPTFVNVTQTQSAMCLVDAVHGGWKKAFEFWGQNTTGITAMYVNLYRKDPSSGALNWVWSSANIVGSVSNTLARNPVNIAAANYINSDPSETYGIELQIIGTGTYQIVGLSGHWITSPHPTAKLRGATRAATVPSWLSAGAGNAGSGTNKVISWNHNIETTANAITVGVNIGFTSTGGSQTVTCGGVAMTSAGTVTYNTVGGVTMQLWIYELINPVGGTPVIPTGNRTITVTASGGGTARIAANSNTYANVGGIGSAVSATGSGTALSHTVSSVTSDAVVQVFGSFGNGNLSGYNKNSRWNQPFSSGNNYATIIGDTVDGAASETFTSTGASGTWGSLAVPLLGVVAAAPSTIATPTYSNNVPWFAFTGTVGTPHIAAQQSAYPTPGTYNYAIPAGVQAGDIFDGVVLGSGGGSGGAVFGAPTFGGTAGTWNSRRMIYGTDIPLGTTTLTVVVPAGGTHGVGGSPGNNGAAATISGTGVTTLSGAGGLGSSNSTSAGQGPGDYSFESVPYHGGAQVALNNAGDDPGGGAASGYGNDGFVGGDGYVSITYSR